MTEIGRWTDGDNGIGFRAENRECELGWYNIRVWYERHAKKGVTYHIYVTTCAEI